MEYSNKTLLERIKRIVKKYDPRAKVYLFGSRVEATFRSDSDWDVLILLDKTNVPPELEKNIAYSLYDLEFETGEMISPMIFSNEEWNTKHSVTSFFNGVMRQAVKL